MASGSSHRNRPEIRNDQEEDDFGDFGGFEGAEQIVDVPSLQAQPADSPWVLFSAGNTSGRPDLLCAQNRFPTYLDPSDISGASGDAVNHLLDNNVIPQVPQDDLFDEININQARIAENILDGTLLASAGSNFHPNLGISNGHLPDIGLGINESRLFNQPDNEGQLPVNPVVRASSLELLIEAPDVEANVLLLERDQEHVAPVVEEAPAVDRPAEVPVNNAELADSLVEQLNALLERNRCLEEELSRCQEQLAAQNSRLEQVQQHYNEELENIRKAGHEALSVVVEQYKEQSRTIVLEQQEIAQRNLVEVVSTQMKAFQDMLQTERELNERQRDEERREMERRIETALAESCVRQQERFDGFLVEEKEKQREFIAKVIEEKSQEQQETLKQELNKEQEKIRSHVEQIKLQCCDDLAEERKQQEAALKCLREEQQKKAEEQISSLVQDEKEKSRAALRTALEQSRLDMQSYIQEQKQSDSLVRQRHLLSLDLFLESSRQQIQLLMQSEKPEPALLSEAKANDKS
ncbi:coiled-coil domain-containing protein 91 [Biomphalaria glabrata]|uniref:Coiled-coil domain-containing protein 91-like n=1 Tax=Biomphalaria glabrata TaxID=6526 RepID=A0A9U8E9M3_BIOGL|nr:coiled-coil domain-containing protein 91-like [Biomphalaria glabrata]KAI8729504.1 coiled-coil domain-containing protein 91-like [Biomphalaria glabrata]KAI8781323.1 coiled-coil domain-containing protein 91 [Biomphalaria glabrata]